MEGKYLHFSGEKYHKFNLFFNVFYLKNLILNLPYLYRKSKESVSRVPFTFSLYSKVAFSSASQRRVHKERGESRAMKAQIIFHARI